MRVLGIDPGLHGGLALYCVNATVPTPPNGIIDMPVCGDESLRRVDYVAVRDWMHTVDPTRVVIERVWAQPMIMRKGKKTGEEKAEGFGGKVNFTLGGAYHAVCAVACCLGHEPELAPKSRWSKAYPTLQREDKEDERNMKEVARLLAIEETPAIEPFLMRKKDHNRAEAWLIARWWAAEIIRRENMFEEQQVERRSSAGGRRRR